MTVAPLLPRSVELGTLTERGDTVAIEATADERAEIARSFGLLGLLMLTADLEVRRATDRSVVAEGRIVADIVQRCVVSLEPVPQHIDEIFERRFVIGAAPEDDQSSGRHAEIELDPAADDPPERIDGPVLDIGSIVLEHFALAIDPYPRAPGASLPADAPAQDAESSDSPFAVLRRLTRKDGE